MKRRFDMRRFAHLALWTLRDARQDTLTYGVVMFGLFVAAICLLTWSGSEGDRVDQDVAMAMAIGLCVSAFIFGSLFFYTRVFANLRDKGKAITYLMLPASPLEKYLCRVLYVCLVLPALALVALWLADAVGTLLAFCLGVDYQMDVAKAVCEVVFQRDHVVVTTTTDTGMSIGGGIFYHNVRELFLMALIICVSTLFRHALVASIGALLVVAVGVVAYVRAMIILGADVCWSFSRLIAVVLAVLTVVLFWLSYWAFTRREIVTHKWFNL